MLQLYVKCRALDFDYDPLNTLMPSEYQTLHDPWLKDYYNKPSVHTKLVKKLDQVDKNNKVLCTLKQYNDYRNYLFRVTQTILRYKEVCI